MKTSRYDGPDLARGKTARHFPPQQAFLDELRNHLHRGDVVVEWGAGHGRFADALREEGHRVYAYDKYHSHGDGLGWELGSVSTELPPEGLRFELGFSAFLLNVIPVDEEDRVLADMEARCDRCLHVVRANELRKDARKSLETQQGRPWDWIVRWFIPGAPEPPTSWKWAVSRITPSKSCVTSDSPPGTGSSGDHTWRPRDTGL